MEIFQKTSQIMALVGAVICALLLTPTAVAQLPESSTTATEPALNYMLFNQPGPLWLPGVDLSGADLFGVDLSDANLRAARFENTTLSRADLSGALLVLAKLRDADLTQAHLQNANLALADLLSANLTGADLDNAQIQGALLSSVRLDGAVLSSADLRQSDIRRASLRSANLNGARLSGSNLLGSDLSGTDLRGADLSSVNLSNALLTDANLEGVFYDRITIWPSNFDPQRRTISGSLPDGETAATSNPEAGEEELSITMTLMPSLVPWFNQIAQPWDTGLVDRAQDVELLDAMAPYVDIYAIQVQRAQSQPETARDFVVPMAAAVRAANPAIETSLQVRTEGSAEVIAALVELSAGKH